METKEFEHGTDTALTDQNGIRQELEQLYMDIFWALALISLCLVALVVFLKKVEPGLATAAL